MKPIEPKPKNLILIVGPIGSGNTIFADIQTILDSKVYNYIVSILPPGKDTANPAHLLKTLAMQTDTTQVLVIQQEKEFNSKEDIAYTIEPLKYADVIIKYQPGQDELFKIIGARDGI